LINLFGEGTVAFIQAIRFVYLLKRRAHTDPEVQLLERFLNVDDVAIDVGANGADWTYDLHQRVGKNGRVYAFEADPYYARATALAVKILGMKGVKLFPFGLSDSEEEAVLRVTDESGLRVSGLGYIDRNAPKDTKGNKAVQLRKLDSLVQDHPALLRTALIKCDVEGYELMVFKGAQEILEKSRPIVILEVGNYEKQGYTARDVMDFFESKQYRAYAMVGGKRLSPTGPMLDHQFALSVNRIMVPRERLGSIEDLLVASTDDASLTHAG
jgi:FkbM family methyltransferase